MTTRRDGEVVEDATFPTLKECPPISRYIFHDQSKSGFRDDPLLGKLSEFDHVILSSHIAFYTDQVKYTSVNKDENHSSNFSVVRIS